MKKFTLFLAALGCFNVILAQNTITTGSINENLCTEQAVTVPFVATGTYNPGNIFTLELSDESGSFPGTVIGQLSCITGCVSVDGTLPAVTGPQYRFRVNASDPATEGVDNGTNINIHSRPSARVNAYNWTPVTGSNIGFNGSATGGSLVYTAYQWSGPNGFVSYQQNPSIQGVTAQNTGAYSLVVTDNFGCSSVNNPVVDLLVYPQELIQQNPAYFLNLQSGANGAIHVVTNLPASCQWQVSLDQGSNWVDLTNNPTYQGVTTPDLQLTNVTETFQGNVYRCRLDFTGIGIAYTKPTLLNVQGGTIITWIDTMAVCGSAVTGIHIPVKVKNFNDVASVSLSIIYSMTDFEYVGIVNVNPMFQSSGMVMTNTIHQNDIHDSRLSWFSGSIYPISIPDSAVVMEIVVNLIGGPSPVSFNTQLGVCQYSDPAFNVFPAEFYNGYVNTVECFSMQGVLTYNNDASSPLAGQKIQLKQNGDVKYETITDVSGLYQFSGVAVGQYDVEVICDLALSPTTSIDALLAAQYFGGVVPLSPLKLLAADVNQNGNVNAIDGLLMLRRSVGLTNFYPAGDWKFSAATVTIVPGGGPQYLDIQALCTGDVNGSYIGQ